MAVRQREPAAGAHYGVGLVFLAAAWIFWPTGPTFVQHWMGVYSAVFFGGVCFLSGFRKSLDTWRINRERAQAMQPSGVFGQAAFATTRECADAGLANPGGLFLGALGDTPLFHNGKAHLLTVAPARQGKGVSVVVPNLLHWQGSVFVTDPKGELAAMTASHRRERFGHKVHIINPWGLHGLPKARFNPLQILLDDARDESRRRDIMDDARAIALQLLPEPDDQKNRYFRDGSRKILIALMLHFATRGQPGTCTMVEVWRTVQNIGRLKVTIAEMAQSTALNYTILDLAEDLNHTIAGNPDQFADFRQGASEAVGIFDPVSWLGDSVAASDFSFEDLKRGRVSVYLVIPQERIETHGKWLGILARQAITAATRERSTDPVLFLLDEFANMGRLSGLGESLTGLPGLGVRVWAIVQELADLRRVYGKELTDTILSQAEVKQFFAVQNNDLARQLSATLGTRTVKTMNYSLGQREDDEITPSVGETGQPLLSADEIRRLQPGKQLILYQHAPPILCDRVAYWEVEPWRQWAEPNPIEGAPPSGRVRLTLRYKQTGTRA
jgi:type IV secretion system protein VirD4